MIANRPFKLFMAILAIGGFAAGCRAMTSDAEAQTATRSEPSRVELPRANVWVTYAPGGVVSTATPGANGTEAVGVGGLRAPIISVRILAREDDSIHAELLTPGGFDNHHIQAGDVRQEDLSGDPLSDAHLRQARLERALMHHRPAVRLRIDRKGEPQIQSSAELRRHEACARRLLRAAIEEQIATAENGAQSRSERERLQEGDFARSVSPPVDHAALLLGLANLSLPRFVSAYDLGLVHAPSSQQDWRSEQIARHGRSVRSEINLLSAGSSSAASLCRSLAYGSISELRSDSCNIEGSIDRRDHWPIALTISRRGEAANGATETQSRSFNRVTPLQGFVAPPSPCPAER